MTSVAAPPTSAQAEARYRPSWVDALQTWLDRGPIPAWMSYLVAWLVLWGLISGSQYAGAALPVGAVPSTEGILFHGALSASSVFYLGAVHYLDRAARRALAAHRPVLDADEATAKRLGYELTTMPARPVLVISLLMAAGQAAVLPLTLPAMRQVGLAASPLATVVDGGLIGLMAVSFGILVYHTVRQLRRVSRIYTRHTRVSLFGLASLYSLAGLNVRTGLTLVVLALVSMSPGLIIQVHPRLEPTAVDLGGFTPLSTGLSYVILAGATAVGVVVASLVGVHRMLEAEKGRARQAADIRLAELVTRLHRKIDDGDYTDADSLNKLIASVIQERDVLAKTPTWPWSPGTQNILISAVVIPIVLWLLQRLLETLLNR